MKKIIPIIRLASKLAEVQRTVGYRKGHLENDSEHSYQLALVCWMANEQYNLNLNSDRILKYALVHDLVEVYAGDVDPFVGSQEAITNKEKEEKRAFEILKQEYSQFRQLLEMIEKYEQKNDIEAQLVYVMDKFLPDINIYYSADDFYIRHAISIVEWEKWLLKKIQYDSLVPVLKSLVTDFLDEVKTNHKDFFYSGS